ncbi:MAG: methyltransferase [Clostridiales bacterium]|nr:methyltransferase [Clostridiales bacterium]
MNSDKYTFEKLAPGVFAAVSSEHSFGTDAVLLADFARPKKTDLALDMGTGCGIIPLLWLKYNIAAPIECIDIQPNAVRQAELGIEKSNATGKIISHCADLRRADALFGAQSFTLITINPPYKRVSSGIESKNQSAKIARHEICCNIDDVAKTAARLLKFSGRFCLCHRPERLADVITALKKYALEPKRLRFVSDRPGAAPFMFLIEAKKGAKPFLSVESELFIKDSNSERTKEIIEIYGAYAEG